MLWIRSKVDAIPLSSEVNLIKVRAALARHRGDRAEEAAILRGGMELVEDRTKDDCMQRLDLAAD